jgi:hypothetical protein
MTGAPDAVGRAVAVTVNMAIRLLTHTLIVRV